MNRIQESDPARADELRQLQQNDPPAFEAEIRKIARERFRERFRDGGPNDRMPGFRPDVQPPGQGGRGTAIMDRIREKENEILAFVKENDPNGAKELEELKTKNPPLYMQKMFVIARRYHEYQKIKDENPELAKTYLADSKLKQQRDGLVRQIRSCNDENQKSLLTAQLKDVVSQRFDLLLKRKQLKYEDLLNKLKNLQAEVEKSKSELEKFSSQKQHQVDLHVQELLSQAEKFDWD